MAIVYMGRRHNQEPGKPSFESPHWGTKDYLRKVRAEPVEGSEQIVPEDRLSPEGKLIEASRA
jgi:hypothetical protein